MDCLAAFAKKPWTPPGSSPSSWQIVKRNLVNGIQWYSKEVYRDSMYAIAGEILFSVAHPSGEIQAELEQRLLSYNQTARIEAERLEEERLRIDLPWWTVLIGQSARQRATVAEAQLQWIRAQRGRIPRLERGKELLRACERFREVSRSETSET